MENTLRRIIGYQKWVVAGGVIVCRLGGSAGLGDDPDSLFSYWVGADDAPAVLQGELVLLAVTGLGLAPVPQSVTGQVTVRILTRLLQKFQRPRSGY